jgi:peptide/nickel transport system ATP-binding protein
LSVVEYFCDDVVVMYLGRVMERGPTERVFAAPHHPYTRALLASAPDLDPDRKRDRIVLQGEIPSPANPPPGCVFNTRCPFAIEACRGDRPVERPVGTGHFSACIREDLPR